MKKIAKVISTLLIALAIVGSVATIRNKVVTASIDPPGGRPVLASIDPPGGSPIHK